MRVAVLIRAWSATWKYLKLKHQKGFPNPVVPKTLNDKFFWRKIFDENPLFPVVADKVRVREWLAEEGFDIPAARHLWIGTDPDEIPEEIWKGGVILKANHASGRNILLRKPPVNRETAKSRLRRFLRLRYGVRWHEAYYWRIPRKIVAEELVEDVRIEIKFYTCGGTVPWAWVAYDRPQRQHGAIWKTGADGKLYVTDELSLDFSGSANEPLPECAEEAATLAREIGKHFDLVRVDFLSNGKDLWFSELTLTGAGGHFDDEAKSVVDETNEGWDLR